MAPFFAFYSVAASIFTQFSITVSQIDGDEILILGITNFFFKIPTMWPVVLSEAPYKWLFLRENSPVDHLYAASHSFFFCKKTQKSYTQ